ncbi:nucleic-acid-binding protein from transposon X-element [Trichonephila clavipes]|nr:nucleic-acid-binding protein from transposon X-element [Trichonephila clavipes]
MRVAASRFVERNSRKDLETRPLRRPPLIFYLILLNCNPTQASSLDLPSDLKSSISKPRLLATFEPPIRTLSLRQAHPQKDSATISIWDGGTLRVPFPSDIQRHSTPPKETATSLKKQKTTEIVTSNQYDALPSHRDEENEDETEVPVHHNTVRPPPPITIDNVKLQNKLLKKLQDATQQKMKGRMVGKGLRIYPETREAYHAIRKYVETEKLEAFTYQLPEDREIKAVIRGMPADTPEEIIEDLLTVGIKVNECHAMTNRKTGLPMPLFLLTLPKNIINKDIFNMTELCYLKIKVEPLRPKIGLRSVFAARDFSIRRNTARGIRSASSAASLITPGVVRRRQQRRQLAVIVRVITLQTTQDVQKIP